MENFTRKILRTASSILLMGINPPFTRYNPSCIYSVSLNGSMICWEIDSIEEAREKDGQVNPHMERMTEMEENKRMREKERHHDHQRYIYMCIERESCKELQ